MTAELRTGGRREGFLVDALPEQLIDRLVDALPEQLIDRLVGAPRGEER